MKLTKAQIAALQAVGRGEVVWSQARRMADPDCITGANRRVVERLCSLGLISRPISFSLRSAAYILTEAGRAVLDGRQK